MLILEGGWKCLNPLNILLEGESTPNIGGLEVLKHPKFSEGGLTVGRGAGGAFVHPYIWGREWGRASPL